ncbi:MAG: hypothetical protein ACREJQ_02460 [bacterium]
MIQIAKNKIPARDDALVQKLYEISQGDTDHPGLLPAGLGALAHTTADQLHDLIAVEKNDQGMRRESVGNKLKANRALHLLLSKAQDFLKSVGLRTQASRAPWKLDKNIPRNDADLISVADTALLQDASLPVGDPHKFTGGRRLAIIADHNALQTLITDTATKKGAAETAVAAKDGKRKDAVAIYQQARDHLYATLPDGKFDKKLEWFGFDVWDKPVRHRPAITPP